MDILTAYEKAKSIPKENWWRTLSYLLNAFVLLPNITLLMFIIYMGEHDFFSYDFINEGIFGMKLFFLTTAIFLFISSIMIYAPGIILFARKTGHAIDRTTYIIFAFITGVTWLMLGIQILNESDYGRIVFVFVICAFMAIHITVLVFCDAKKQFLSLLALTTGVVFLSINFPTQASKVISIGLKSYGVGGDLPISIADAQSGLITKGKLKLITPNNIYFSPEESGGVATYSLNSVSYYIVRDKPSTKGEASTIAP